ncbi:MAG: 1-phosphofructokinase family hexose kinase [Lagierella massiliensis]|nr:1-phosphofructokinase family hexose kinase [Lagierella massiliensis]
MIYTISLNPSMDFIVEVDEIKKDFKNRMKNDLRVPGGKAINVARVLRRLGMPSVATGFLGGHTGEFIKDWLKMEGIKTSFIEIDDETRINIKLYKQNIVINGKGPKISFNEQSELLYFISRIREGDTVILMGSIPPNVDEDILDRIISICKANKAEFIVDASPKKLKTFVERQPLMIKPNIEDVEEIFEVSIEDEPTLIKYGQKLLKMGAKHVIISLGKDGAYLFSGDCVFKGDSLKGEEVKSEGVRDSMIAGFIATFIRTSDLEESFKIAMSCATATAFSKDLARRDEIDKISKKIVVHKIC